MRYCLLSLGCQMNQSDGERVRTVLEGLGFTRTENEEEANLLGIVSCSVRQKAIDRVYAKIHAWNLAKHNRNLLTFVTGCVLPADRVKFLRLFDLVFAVSELPQLPDMIRQYGVPTPIGIEAATPTPDGATARLGGLTVLDGVTPLRGAAPGTHGADGPTPPTTLVPLIRASVRAGGERKIGAALAEGGGRSANAAQADPIGRFWHIQPTYASSFEAYVPIQNGCDKFCTFCAVPYTRGREVSRPSEEILAEVESLVGAGYASITLLGQNVNSYGLDRRGAEMPFARLLREIGEIGRRSGRELWVYFTSPHPRDMKVEVIETIAEYPSLAKQIHLPIQSGDDKVLIRMNRNYRVDQYREVVANIRSLLPTATLFTDIIVGFTGESEEQFEGTRAALREFRYNMAYIAMYSPRPGAASARWADDVPHEEKKRRLHELSDELQAISLELNREMIGRVYRVLVSGRDRLDGYLSGRTEGKIIVRFPAAAESLIGRFVDVRIDRAAEMSVEGELVESAKPALARR